MPIYKEGYTQNRELSWLKFNKRVLYEARDKSEKLLERIKFVSIFESNLDEFFMVRVGSLTDLSQINASIIDTKSGKTPKEQLEAIYTAVKPMYVDLEKTYFSLMEELKEKNIIDLAYNELTKVEKQFVKEFFYNDIYPVLSPTIIDRLHPFPNFINKELQVGCVLTNSSIDHNLFGVVTIPKSLPDVLYLPGGLCRYIRIENIIIKYLDKIFENFNIKETAVFCVTRNADINPNDDQFDFDDDFRDKMKKLVLKRKRLQVVRLEISNKISKEFLNYLLSKLKIEQPQTFISKVPFSLAYTFSLADRLSDREKSLYLHDEYEHAIPKTINPNKSMISQLKQKDILLSYPYDSMKPYLNLLKEASENKDVVSIEITIYRLAKRANIVDYLCRAAENGKNVTCLMELRARFDEQNNIDYSEKLEESGCKIIYGFENYKVHSKITLITIKNKSGYEYITQVGTGNYNEKTAKLYADLCLMTSNKEIGQDADNFFKNMLISNLNGRYRHLIVSPSSLKPKILNLIEREKIKGKQGKIICKVNSFTDVDIIKALSEASNAGVKIDLIVRGICCLLPGIKNKTENIHIIGIVGRYLEHARVYWFGQGDEEIIYISSADFMTRNTEKRVEVACPVYDEEAKKRIKTMINLQFEDNTKARMINSHGDYEYIKDNKDRRIESQKELTLLAINNGIKETAKPSKSLVSKIISFMKSHL